MKTCIYCKIEKPDESFTKRTIKKNGKKYSSSSCRKCEIIRMRESRRALKREIIALAGGKCIICGYDKCVAALDFHHRDPLQKTSNLNRAFNISKKVIEEISKCDLVCSNCHREIHFNQKNNL
jgi:hypothetical protein